MLALAFIPGLVLLFTVWKLDTIEKESPILLLKLFGAGAAVMLIDILLRTLGLKLLEHFYNGTSILLYTFIEAFIFTALIEEAGRFIVLKLLTWKDREFNYTFDAIVYSVAVSVGFLITENVVYVIKYGSALKPAALVLPVFAQIIISVFMGYSYGLGKIADSKNDTKNRKVYLAEAVLVPIAIHGIYAMCIKAGTAFFYVILAVYMIAVTAISVVIFIKIHKEDASIEWDTTDINEGDGFEINVTDLLHRKESFGKEADNEGKV